jgi:LmbE family N-acetylglucosaminyl deacetylase
MTDRSGDSLGTILGVWAHPDDETWLTAALMARAVQAGRRVVCVTATKGEAGFPANDPRSAAERAAVRAAEMAASMAALGVTEHRWLGFADGGCAAVPDEEGVAIVHGLIDEIRPDTLITFGPDGGTGHGDHVAVCRWSTAAVEAAGDYAPRLLYATRTREWTERVRAGFDLATVMMIEGFEPEMVESEELAVWLHCDDGELDRKIAALRSQASQIEPLVEAYGLEILREANRDEHFREPRPGDAATLEAFTAYSRAALT